MSIITELINFDISTTLITFLIGFVFYYLSKFYLKVWSLPPGPIPIPFVGNLLLLRRAKKQAKIEILKYSKKYGPVFTFWFGPKPMVVITDRDIAIETFTKNEFAGRPDLFLFSLVNHEPYNYVALTETGKQLQNRWQVSHCVFVNEVVDNTVETILEKEGINKSFDAHKYFYLTFLNTSKHAFKWILKIMAFYPEIQNKLRQEIEKEIGDRMPTQEDRNRCHYTNAFISETIRFRTVSPTGVSHKTIKTFKIGNFSVPKDTGVAVHQYSLLNDEKYWEKPNEVIPERFLENGEYVSPLPSVFIPFSVGRRVCLDEKLALADLFLVLVRLLQKTNGYNIALEQTDDNYNLDIDEKNSELITPKKVRIIFEQ